MTSIRLVAVGDLMLGDSSTCVGFGFRSRVAPAQLADRLRAFPELREADIAFANLEAGLDDGSWRPSDWRDAQMRGRPEYGAVLAKAGFRVLNVANNHAVQHGLGAFEDTVTRVRDAGMMVCGLRGSREWAGEPVRLDIRGARLGCLGYCLRPRQYGSGVPPYAEGDADAVVADVRRLAAEGRTVIVSLHWGEEFVPQPSSGEVAVARRIVEAGAAVVLGHHPHVARPVERYRNGVIAYSLGNFAADMIWYAPLRLGVMLDCVVRDGAVEAVTVRRHYIDDRYLPAALPDPGPEVSMTPLPDQAYAREIALTVARQRRALYRYTARNLWRFPPRGLMVLAARTLRNKLAALGARAGGRDR